MPNSRVGHEQSQHNDSIDKPVTGQQKADEGSPYMQQIILGPQSTGLAVCYELLEVQFITKDLNKRLKDLFLWFYKVNPTRAFYSGLDCLRNSQNRMRIQYELNNWQAYDLILQWVKKDLEIGVDRLQLLIKLRNIIVEQFCKSQTQNVYPQIKTVMDTFQLQKEIIIKMIDEKIEELQQRKKTRALQSYKKSVCLQETCLQMSERLFRSSIVAIVKKSEFEDYIIMEQCYPVKTMVKKKLLSFLGEELYDEKILAFYRGERRMSSLGSENNNWIICHYCHKLIHGQYIKCSNSKAKQYSATARTTPSLSYKIKQENDYTALQNPPHTELQLNYFIYGKNKFDNFCCNKYLCQQCAIRIGATRRQNYYCDFCCDACECMSCLQHCNLVRLLGSYYGMWLNQEINREDLLPLVDAVNFEDFFQNQPLIRTGFHDSGYGFKEKYRPLSEYLHKYHTEYIRFMTSPRPSSCSEDEEKQILARFKKSYIQAIEDEKNAEQLQYWIKKCEANNKKQEQQGEEIDNSAVQKLTIKDFQNYNRQMDYGLQLQQQQYTVRSRSQLMGQTFKSPQKMDNQIKQLLQGGLLKLSDIHPEKMSIKIPQIDNRRMSELRQQTQFKNNLKALNNEKYAMPIAWPEQRDNLAVVEDVRKETNQRKKYPYSSQWRQNVKRKFMNLKNQRVMVDPQYLKEQKQPSKARRSSIRNRLLVSRSEEIQDWSRDEIKKKKPKRRHTRLRERQRKLKKARVQSKKSNKEDKMSSPISVINFISNSPIPQKMSEQYSAHSKSSVQVIRASESEQMP